MNKKMEQSSAKETGQPEALVESTLDAGLEDIHQAMKREAKVTLQNFSTFYINVRRSGTVFKFNLSQQWNALFGWSSSYRGEL